MAFGLALAMNTEGRAAEIGSLKLPRNMAVAGVDLRAGTYAVQCKVKGIHATVILSREGRTVATVQGECVTFDRSVATTTLYFSKIADGFFAINAMGFAGTNKGILFPLVRSDAHPPTGLPMNDLWENRWQDNAMSVPRLHK
jgi:hypothetical protein